MKRLPVSVLIQTGDLHELNIECNICGKFFSSKKSLKIHISSVHEDMKKYNCETCEKSFSSTQALKRHIECIHEDKKARPYNYIQVFTYSDICMREQFVM